MMTDPEIDNLNKLSGSDTIETEAFVFHDKRSKDPMRTSTVAPSRAPNEFGFVSIPMASIPEDSGPGETGNTEDGASMVGGNTNNELGNDAELQQHKVYFRQLNKIIIFTYTSFQVVLFRGMSKPFTHRTTI